MLDPIAGAFQKYDDNDQEKFEPNKTWHHDMVSSGFGSESMENTDYDTALPWLGARIVEDPRFSLSVVYSMFTALTGQEPLEYPADPNSPTLKQELRLVGAGRAVPPHRRRLRGRELQPEERGARRGALAVLPRQEHQGRDQRGSPASSFAGVGTGRLIIPEVLGRKVRAVTGLTWGKGVGYNKTDYLGSDYRILYGGIDSDDVTKRLRRPQRRDGQRRLAHGQRGRLPDHGLGPVPRRRVEALPVPVRGAGRHTGHGRRRDQEEHSVPARARAGRVVASGRCRAREDLSALRRHLERGQGRHQRRRR